MSEDAAARREAALARVDALAADLAAEIRAALDAEDDVYRGLKRVSIDGKPWARDRIKVSLRRLQLAQEPHA